jgi:hypothetical protein
MGSCNTELILWRRHDVARKSSMIVSRVSTMRSQETVVRYRQNMVVGCCSG